MLLAELHIWHTRPLAPTRRLALGDMTLPVDPAPGLGGVLLAAIVAAYLPSVPDDQRAEVPRLLDQIVRGDRVVQPRLGHRYQVDRHALAISVHQMTGDAENVEFDLHSLGRPLTQVLGAVYALERLDPSLRPGVAAAMRRAMSWRGPLGPSFVADITGLSRHSLVGVADPRLWALTTLGFPLDSGRLGKSEIMKHYRSRLRAAPPDHGGADDAAGVLIEQLGEARRILLER